MLNAMREEENILRANLGIFKIEQPASKDLQNLEKENPERVLLNSSMRVFYSSCPLQDEYETNQSSGTGRHRGFQGKAAFIRFC